MCIDICLDMYYLVCRHVYRHEYRQVLGTGSSRHYHVETVHTRVCAHVCTHVCKHVCTHACTNVCTHLRTHLCITHMSTHMSTHMLSSPADLMQPPGHMYLPAPQKLILSHAHATRRGQHTPMSVGRCSLPCALRSRSSSCASGMPRRPALSAWPTSNPEAPSDRGPGTMWASGAERKLVSDRWMNTAGPCWINTLGRR